MDKKQTDDLIAEIRAVKMLLVLQLIESGVKQSVIASFLGISEATVSRMLSSTKKSKKRIGGT